MNTSTTSRRAALWRLARNAGAEAARLAAQSAPRLRSGGGIPASLSGAGSARPVDDEATRQEPYRTPRLTRAHWRDTVYRHDNALLDRPGSGACTVSSWFAAQLSYRMAVRAYGYGYREGIRVGASTLTTRPADRQTIFLAQSHGLPRPNPPSDCAWAAAFPPRSADLSYLIPQGSAVRQRRPPPQADARVMAPDSHHVWAQYPAGAGSEARPAGVGPASGPGRSQGRIPCLRRMPESRHPPAGTRQEPLAERVRQG